jgi:hypothetical protein
MRLRTGLTAAVGMALALTLSLSSCSGDDEPLPAASGDPTTPTTTQSFTGAGGGGFCDLVRDQSSLDYTALSEASPDETRVIYESFRSVVRDMVKAAPPEISADVQLISDAYDTMYDEYEKVDYQFDRLPPDLAQALDGPAVIQATERLDAYAAEVCGIDPAE